MQNDEYSDTSATDNVPTTERVAHPILELLTVGGLLKLETDEFDNLLNVVQRIMNSRTKDAFQAGWSAGYENGYDAALADIKEYSEAIEESKKKRRSDA